MAKNGKKSEGVKWALTGIAFVLVFVILAGILMQVFGKGKVKPSEWFNKPGTEQTSTSNVIIGEGHNSGISLASMPIPTAEYEDYGISAQAESAAVVTATFTPAETTNQAVTWSCDDESGKVTVTPVEGEPLKATVAVTGGFNTQVTVTCTSDYNNTLKATLTVDYVKHLEGLTSNTVELSSLNNPICFNPDLVYSVGTLEPDIVETTLRISINSSLINYLKPKYSKLVNAFSLLAVNVKEFSKPLVTILAEQYYPENVQEYEEKIKSDIALFYYGKTNQEMFGVAMTDVKEIYNDKKSSSRTLPLTRYSIGTFADITILGEGLTLDNSQLIFGYGGLLGE